MPSRRRFLAQSLGAALLACPGLAGCRANAGQGEAEPRGVRERIDRLRPVAEAALAATRTPGLSYALFDRTGIAARGLGLLRAGASDPVTTRSIFPAASLSKPAFAFIVMTVAQQRRVGRPAPFGSFDLDAPLGSFGALAQIVPAPFAIDDPRMRRVTPRMLLEHSHAIGWRWDGEAGGRARTGAAFMTGEPGRAFDYAPQGYACLQGLIETLTGRDLEALARDRLFAPFGMRDSSFLWRPGFAGRTASGHDRAGVPGAEPGDEWARLAPAEQQEQRRIGLGPANAPASLKTSATDYARFVRGLLLGATGAGRSPLSPSWSREMLMPRIRATDRIWWGPGWGFLRGSRDLAWHYGNLGDHQSFVFADPASGRGAVFLANSGNGLSACRRICGELEPATGAIFDWLDAM